MAPTPAKNITLTLDAQLQAYGEKLMQNKRGGIVAIEPATGEVLALRRKRTARSGFML